MPQQTAEPTTQTVFRSRDPNLRLVRKPQRKIMNMESGEFEVTSGVTYEFQTGVFKTHDPEVVEWLREHRLYNRRFSEEGNEPDLPRPTTEEQLRAITKATALRDEEALVSVKLSESETHSRGVVLSAAQDAIETVRALNEQVPDAPPVADTAPVAAPEAEADDPVADDEEPEVEEG